jgi:hypothetical protein
MIFACLFSSNSKKYVTLALYSFHKYKICLLKGKVAETKLKAHLLFLYNSDISDPTTSSWKIVCWQDS